MKRFIFLALFGVFFLVGCEKKATFGFTSSNCNEVYTICMNKCLQSNKKRTECTESCERSRGMCAAIKVKGCLQDCNKTYGKNTLQAETCKNNCTNNAN